MRSFLWSVQGVFLWLAFALPAYDEKYSSGKLKYILWATAIILIFILNIWPEKQKIGGDGRPGNIIRGASISLFIVNIFWILTINHFPQLVNAKREHIYVSFVILVVSIIGFLIGGALQREKKAQNR
ncbi:hypothetical protein ABAC460_03275 [Asticcacaulis sp. AC460]|nr:hypothetical protein ABAC460_03275 [Asticcacaulis sp. AC460]